jgi:hypothetical protein
MTTELVDWNHALRMRKSSPMVNPPHIDWEKFVKDEEELKGPAWHADRHPSFFEQQVFDIPPNDQQEELAESIVV